MTIIHISSDKLNYEKLNSIISIDNSEVNLSLYKNYRSNKHVLIYTLFGSLEFEVEF